MEAYMASVSENDFRQMVYGIRDCDTETYEFGVRIRPFIETLSQKSNDYFGKQKHIGSSVKQGANDSLDLNMSFDTF
jgi:hypothetical protein